MTDHPQQRRFGYGPIGGREYHDYTLIGREFQLTIGNWNEERQAYDEETMLVGKLLPGIESKTTKKKTRWQKRVKVGKDILVYKRVYKDRSKYLANGKLKEVA